MLRDLRQRQVTIGSFSVGSLLRLVLVVFALATLLALSLLGFSWIEGQSAQEWLNQNQHPVGILITVCFIGLGLVGWFIRDEQRQRLRARGISSVGMSALVEPLLEIGLNLWELAAAPQTTTEEWRKAKRNGEDVRRLKWPYGKRLKKRYSLPTIQTIHPAWANPDVSSEAADMADQAVRRLMVSLRSWADLLSQTPLGLDAMISIGDLRQELFLLSQTEPPSSSEGEVLANRYAECALRALLLAQIFEACGGALHPRSAFVGCLRDWELPGYSAHESVYGHGANPSLSPGRLSHSGYGDSAFRAVVAKDQALRAGVTRTLNSAAKAEPSAAAEDMSNIGLALLAKYTRDFVDRQGPRKSLLRSGDVDRGSIENLVSDSDAPIRLSPRYATAVLYAADAHATQVRKGTKIPYVSHLLAVSSLVLDGGGDEDVAIAALLHDVAEDQGGQPRLEDVRRHFGERVAGIVEECSDSLTEDPEAKAPWIQRKQSYITHLSHASDDALLVTTADKLHNARAICVDLRLDGPQTLGRFKGSPEQILWYYREVLAVVRERGVSSSLVGQLEESVTLLERLIGIHQP